VGTKISDIINNRVVAIVAHGSSLDILEREIQYLKHKDICWMSLGLYTVVEDFILSKIDKRLDILFDCATVPEPQMDVYEKTIRLPRIERFLAREDNNLWITTHGLIRDSITPYKPDIWQNYQNKILKVDSLFPQNNIPFYMDVPNSITLMIASALCGGAKKIILFGYDGHVGADNLSHHTYYKEELAHNEWVQAYGESINLGLKRDTLDFENRFAPIVLLYRTLFNNRAEILNCSPNSNYRCLRQISYGQLKEELE
jgi:hypothetical protein